MKICVVLLAELTGLDLSRPFEEQFLEEYRCSNALREQEITAIERHTATVIYHTAAIQQNISAEQKNTFALEENTLALQQNTLTLEQSRALLCAVRDGEVTLPPKVTAALAQAFRESDESVLMELLKNLPPA